MAPEVVRREAPPSDKTDRYSLAVLLFLLLYGGHPLDGRRESRIRCLDVSALERLYGFDPVWCLVSDGCELRATAQETMWIDVRVPNEVPWVSLLIAQVESAVTNVLDVEVETIGEAECEFLAPPSG